MRIFDYLVFVGLATAMHQVCAKRGSSEHYERVGEADSFVLFGGAFEEIRDASEASCPTARRTSVFDSLLSWAEKTGRVDRFRMSLFIFDELAA
ncbi:hypothetical protein [Arthrobacter sp. NPDC090010]|uniref:hypothetical protein n=1 Tax=Arthrobacter sp. NPDC090010 TaxID=3363942 RepID=UPI00380F0BE1